MFFGLCGNHHSAIESANTIIIFIDQRQHKIQAALSVAIETLLKIECE
jgi:hypothetical protein